MGRAGAAPRPGNQSAERRLAEWRLYSRELFRQAGRARSYSVQPQGRGRDVLEVPLSTLTGLPVHVLVNHWPSRLIPEAEAYRLALASHVAARVDRLLKVDPATLRRRHARLASRRVAATVMRRWSERVLVLGDFNDEPFSRSVDLIMGATRHRSAAVSLPAGGGAALDLDRYASSRPRLFNPTWQLLTRRAPPHGTSFFNGEWYLFDQVLLSPGWMLGGAGPRYVEQSLRIASRAGPAVSLVGATGRPAPFSPATRRGASDHLPLIFGVEL